MASGLSRQVAQRAEVIATRPRPALVTCCGAAEDQPVWRGLLGGYTVLPMILGEGDQTRAAVALLCRRHKDTPKLLMPGTALDDGGHVDQRGLDMGMLVDLAARHEREWHR